MTTVWAYGTWCLPVTCDEWENGKSVSSIDTGRASIGYGAKTDSDLARPHSGQAEDRAQQEDRVWIRADDVYPEGWRSIH